MQHWIEEQEGQDMDVKPLGLNGFSLYDLMAEELTVWVGKNKEFGYVMEIETEDGEIMQEKCIHPYAMESFASFCRRYLSFYDKLEAA